MESPPLILALYSEAGPLRDNRNYISVPLCTMIAVRKAELRKTRK